MQQLPTLEELQRAPKVLLHDHLDGGLRPATVIELAGEVGYDALPTTDEADLADWFTAGAARQDLELYLETFAHTVAVMQTKDALTRVAAECAEDLAADGVVYAEVRFAPELHLEGGLTLDEVVEAVLEGFRLGSAGTTLTVGTLLTAMRHAAHSTEIAELAVRHRDSGVVGFDIAGSEAGHPPTRHLDAFRLVASENFHITIHAGEAFGLPSIWEAVQLCGAERLGHGVRIVDDIAVDDDGRAALGRLASFVRDRRVPLEMCPTSNVNTGVCDSIARPPDRPARRAALPRHGEHRQPAHERRAPQLGDGRPRRRVRLRLGRDRVAHAERHEELVLAVRPAAADHQRADQARASPLLRAARL